MSSSRHRRMNEWPKSDRGAGSGSRSRRLQHSRWRSRRSPRAPRKRHWSLVEWAVISGFPLGGDSNRGYLVGLSTRCHGFATPTAPLLTSMPARGGRGTAKVSATGRGSLPISGARGRFCFAETRAEALAPPLLPTGSVPPLRTRTSGSAYDPTLPSGPGAPGSAVAPVARVAAAHVRRRAQR